MDARYGRGTFGACKDGWAVLSDGGRSGGKKGELECGLGLADAGWAGDFVDGGGMEGETAVEEGVEWGKSF